MEEYAWTRNPQSHPSPIPLSLTRKKRLSLLGRGAFLWNNCDIISCIATFRSFRTRSMMDWPRSLPAPLRVVRYYATGLWRRLWAHPIFLWAQAIAFKVLVTLIPLVVLATGIFGLALRQDNPFEAVARYLRTFLPPEQGEPLIQVIDQLQRASGTLTFLGAFFLLAMIVTLFGRIRYVVGAAMGESRHRRRGEINGYVFDARMILQVGVLFVLSFGVTLAVNVLASEAEWLVRAGLDPDLFRTISGRIVRFVSIAVPYLLTVGMLWQLYYFVPRPRPPKRSALLGAAVASVLFEGAKNGFALYATTIGNFDRYARPASEGFNGLGGFFGLILAFGFWVYVSGLILIIGAFVTVLNEQKLSPRRSTLRRNRPMPELQKRWQKKLEKSNRLKNTGAEEDTLPNTRDPEH